MELAASLIPVEQITADLSAVARPCGNPALVMKIVELAARENYQLFLRYDDRSKGVVNLSALAGRGVFAAWLEPGVFEQVTLSEFGAPEWPGEPDLCTDALYLQLTGKSVQHGLLRCFGASVLRFQLSAFQHFRFQLSSLRSLGPLVL